MTQEEENEIREIVALHHHIEELKQEISKRLKPFRDKDLRHFVVGDEIWQLTRWAELRVEPPHKAMFSAWCLERVGKKA